MTSPASNPTTGAARRKSGMESVISYVLSEKAFPRVIRLGTCLGVVSGLVQFLDRFESIKLPTDALGILIFVLVSLVLFLGAELALIIHHRPSPLGRIENRTPEIMFADSVLEYAKNLAQQGRPRDHALINLRNWASRALHLCGAHSQRHELGQLALTAAAALSDRHAQASILLDDLGWSMFESNHLDAGSANIEEAIQILNEELEKNPSDPAALELRTKALRHLANIQAKANQYGRAMEILTEARNAMSLLPEPTKKLHAAQLDHSEAQIRLSELERTIGPASQVDPSGHHAGILVEALKLAQAAESTFHDLGDLEREAKALKLRVHLLAHDPRKQLFREASTRLQRIEAQVERKLTV